VISTNQFKNGNHIEVATARSATPAQAASASSST